MAWTAVTSLLVAAALVVPWWASDESMAPAGAADAVGSPSPAVPRQANAEVAAEVVLAGAPTDDLAIAPPLAEPVAAAPSWLAPAGEGAPIDVALIGDSVSLEIRDYLEANVVGVGGRFQYAGIGGIAACDLADGVGQLAGGELGPRPDVAVLLFTGNVLTPCITERVTDARSLRAAYRGDLAALIDQLVSADIAVAVVGVPVSRDAAPSGLDRVYRRLADDYTAAGADVRFVDVMPGLSPGGRFHAELPCVAGEPACEPGRPVPVRALDGGHLCGGVVADGEVCHGAWRLASAVTSVVQA